MTWCWPNGVTDPASPPPMGAGYGPRPPIQTPEGWTGNFHTGVDFKHDFATVRSVGPGLVVYVGDRGTGNGLEVVVDHGTWLSRYYHLASRKADIYVGVWVDGGRALGMMGDTGKAKGIHLHLRFDTQAESGDASGRSFDPLPLLLLLLRTQASGGSGTAGGGTTPIDTSITDLSDYERLIMSPKYYQKGALDAGGNVVPANPPEYGIFGNAVQGGFRKTGNVETAKAWGKLYGTEFMDLNADPTQSGYSRKTMLGAPFEVLHPVTWDVLTNESERAYKDLHDLIHSPTPVLNR